jgi:hypothetical protein
VRTIRNTKIQFVPHRKHVSATETNRLILFRETVAVHCKNHTEHTDTFCGENVKSFSVTSDGVYSYHCVISQFGKPSHQLLAKLEHKKHFCKIDIAPVTCTGV